MKKLQNGHKSSQKIAKAVFTRKIKDFDYFSKNRPNVA